MIRHRSRTVVLPLLAAIALTPTALRAGVQTTPDSTRTMVNSDVGIERWAVTQHPDGSLTGNVFRQDGGDPAFIACTPTAEMERYTCMGGDGCLTPSSEPGGGPRGVSQSPTNDLLFASKDVGTERWAITENDDGTLTGNVFRSDGTPPAFIYCEPEGSDYRCFGADACLEEPCGDYDEIGVLPLPADFFTRPAGCPDTYTLIAEDVIVSAEFFEPLPLPPLLSDPCLAASSWPKFNRDTQNSARVDVPAPENPSIKWQFPVGAGLDGRAVAIDVGGNIITGATEPDGVFSVKPVDGSLNWAFEGEGGALGTEFSAPTIGADGTVYVTARHGAIFGCGFSGALVAIDGASGELRWAQCLGDFQSAQRPEAPPTVGRRDNSCSLYVLTREDLVAFDLAGSERWRYRPGPPFDRFGADGVATPAVGTDGTVYVAFNDQGFVYGVSPQGGQRFQFLNPTADDVTCVTVGPEGNLFVTGETNSFSLDPAGGLRWSWCDASRCSTSIRIDGCFVLGPDGRLYATGGGIIAVDRQTGDVEVVSNLDSNRFRRYPVVMRDGTALLNAKSILPPNAPFIDASGPAAIGPDGTIYGQGRDKLFAIR